MSLNREVVWSPGITLEYLEEKVIKEAMKFYHNNKTQVAASLGIAIRTLDNKLNAYKLKDETPKEVKVPKAVKKDAARVHPSMRRAIPGYKPENDKFYDRMSKDSLTKEKAPSSLTNNGDANHNFIPGQAAEATVQKILRNREAQKEAAKSAPKEPSILDVVSGKPSEDAKVTSDSPATATATDKPAQSEKTNAELLAAAKAEAGNK